MTTATQRKPKPQVEFHYVQEHFDPRCDATIPAAWTAHAGRRIVASHDTLDLLVQCCRAEGHSITKTAIQNARYFYEGVE